MNKHWITYPKHGYVCQETSVGISVFLCSTNCMLLSTVHRGRWEYIARSIIDIIIVAIAIFCPHKTPFNQHHRYCNQYHHRHGHHCCFTVIGCSLTRVVVVLDVVVVFEVRLTGAGMGDVKLDNPNPNS